MNDVPSVHRTARRLPRRAVLRWIAAGAGVFAIGARTGTARARQREAGSGGRLALIRSHRLMVREPDGTERALLQVPDTTFLSFPAWAAGGEWIAHARTVLDPSAPPSAWGDEVYATPLDGSPSRLLLPRAHDGGVIQGICCAPDGTSLLFGYHATLVENGRFAGSIERIERLDLASGERSTLLEGALFPSITQDGSRIAYMMQDDRGRVSLGIAAADGGERRVVAQLGSRFLLVLTPRISPDGSTIVFSAVPPLAAAQATDLGPRGPAAGRPVRHGLPMDLFLANVATGAVTRLTTFGEDEPYPAWSPNGEVITILATGGLYELKVDGSEPHLIGPGEFGGYLDAR